MEIDKIIIHCSDSPWGDSEVIDGWHKERGWNGIGYHAVICNGYRKNSREYSEEDNGLIQLGRDVKTPGAHCKGQNKSSLGICLIGNKGFTEKQHTALSSLLKVWGDIYGVPLSYVYGHREFDGSKTCPNFAVNEWIGG